MVKIPRIIRTVIVNCWLKRPGTSYSSSCESCLSIEWILSRNDTSRHRFPVNRIEGNVIRRAGSNARLKFKGESCCTQRRAIDRWIKETSRTMSDTIPMVLWQILCRRQPIIQPETRKICRLVAKNLSSSGESRNFWTYTIFLAWNSLKFYSVYAYWTFSYSSWNCLAKQKLDICRSFRNPIDC